MSSRACRRTHCAAVARKRRASPTPLEEEPPCKQQALSNVDLERVQICERRVTELFNNNPQPPLSSLEQLIQEHQPLRPAATPTQCRSLLRTALDRPQVFDDAYPLLILSALDMEFDREMMDSLSKDKMLYNPEILVFCLRHKLVDPNLVLEYAMPHVQIMRLAVEAGANVLVPFPDAKTPVQYVAECLFYTNPSDFTQMARCRECLEFLLECGADIEDVRLADEEGTNNYVLGYFINQHEARKRFVWVLLLFSI